MLDDMRNRNDFRTLLISSRLNDGFQTDPVVAECRRDGSENARLIINEKAHIVGRFRFLHGAKRFVRIACAVQSPERIELHVARDVDDVGDDG